MERAALFLTAYREVLGEPPAPTDTSAILATIEQFVPVRAALPHRQRLLAAVEAIRVLPARPRHLPA